LAGAISRLNGAYPTVTFTIRNTEVTTTGTTTFERVTGATLRNDIRVEVKGTKTSRHGGHGGLIAPL
jgi:Domain of unknown function (DUF5666)